ncbi:MAG TPA: glycosyltransferase family 2 protein [Steroidobacteraceae bacterium]
MARASSQSDSVVVAPFLRGVRNGPRLLSAVVPVHNEAGGIAKFLQSLAAALAEVAPNFEIIVVNDGSRDTSGIEISRVSIECRVCYLELSRNFGKEAALTAGMETSRGECVLLIDSDGQHPVAAIAEMVNLWRQGYQNVYGVRTTTESESSLRRFARAAFYKMLSRASEVPIPEGAGDFRLLDRDVVTALLRLPERNRFMKGLYAWVGFRSIAFTFQTVERSSGESSFRLRNLAELALTGLTAFSGMPLRLVSVAGLVVSLASMAYGLYIVLEKLLFGQPIPGFSTVAASVLFLSGVQLVSLGIIGEYVGRVFVEVKRRPSYLLAKTVDSRALAPRSMLEGEVSQSR